MIPTPKNILSPPSGTDGTCSHAGSRSYFTHEICTQESNANPPYQSLGLHVAVVVVRSLSPSSLCSVVKCGGWSSEAAGDRTFLH
eukprot:scaffold1148_cov209-Alexandrium_tamarense.AAC.19